MRHVGQERRLVVARGLQLAGLLVQPRKRACELLRPLLDLLLQADVRRLEPNRHAVEFVGERAELVAARRLDPLIERPGADLRRRDLDRLNGPDEIAGQQHARHDRHEEEHHQEQRGPPDRGLDRRKRHAEGFLDEDPPPGHVDPLVGAEHFHPVPIPPRGHVGASRRGRGQGGVHLWKGREARVREDEVLVGVGDELATGRDRVGGARLADPRPIDRVHDRPEVDVGHDDASSRSTLCDRQRHVRPGISLGERDIAEVPPLGSRAEELRARGAIPHTGICLELADLE